MTKAATIENHRFLCLIVLAAMLIAMIPVAVLHGGLLAANTDNMDGSFTLGNSAPTIDSVVVTDNGNVTATSLTPQMEYIIKVQVTDANTLADLTTCNVTLFYDADNDNDAGDIPSENTTHAARVVCNQDADTFTLTPEPTTWNAGSASDAPTATDNQGVFLFHILIGKIAIQSSSNWDVYVSVRDDEGGQDDEYSAKDLGMNFYGEVSTSASVDFGSVTAGSTYAANEQGSKSVTYITNGAYDEQVAASATWGGATLDDTDNPGANEFCLQANDIDDIGTAQQVSDTSSYVTIDDSGTHTQSETGDTVGTNTIWLRLGTPFTSGTYDGTIYFKVINGT